MAQSKLAPTVPLPEGPLVDTEASQAEQLSAFIDSNLTESEARRVAEQLSRSPDNQEAALRYWLISDVLSSVGETDHRPELCKKIAARIAQEPVYMPQAVRFARVGESRRPLAPGLRIAASLAGLAFVGAGAFLLLSLPTEPDGGMLVASGGSSVSTPGSSPGVESRVMRASFDSPQARAMLDAHGASHVRLRLDDR
jgi:hypothetical protein